jgi:hypothetical protein
MTGISESGRAEGEKNDLLSQRHSRN